jgi:FkbM family methyltransferase
MAKTTDGQSGAKTWLHAGVWLWRHLRGRYAAEEAAIISSFVAKGDICVDIGAHAGSWTRPLARMVPAGQVYAFEALPHYANALDRLMRLCGHRNVVVSNQAVSDQPGTVEIAWRTKEGHRLTGNTHMATERERSAVECVTVSAVTLDDWRCSLRGTARVSFVKIDVEGAELLVLRGAAQLIERDQPVIFMEIVADCCARYGYAPADLFTLFEKLNYRAFTVSTGASAIVPASAATYSGKGDVLIIPANQALPTTLKVHTAS